ncbi:uncharacterized protein F5Z01DRAFT_658291 [Emericellopsis atlantica]|uniref:Uncharacterized protein n=1 Tax=Emericellopsis atlantica TaxID=2614577 RepID=A0A9P8CMZ8_9HYPO|nr:uncharacterized protein F5Z01DRAFT_658291 [Emericellopsis atlantica]KAG9253244.1 hypothetical protein F5Z01DRAFT_658291 [Emericellopsis atlantica]
MPYWNLFKVKRRKAPSAGSGTSDSASTSPQQPESPPQEHEGRASGELWRSRDVREHDTAHLNSQLSKLSTDLSPPRNAMSLPRCRRSSTSASSNDSSLWLRMFKNRSTTPLTVREPASAELSSSSRMAGRETSMARKSESASSSSARSPADQQPVEHRPVASVPKLTRQISRRPQTVEENPEAGPSRSRSFDSPRRHPFNAEYQGGDRNLFNIGLGIDFKTGQEFLQRSRDLRFADSIPQASSLNFYTDVDEGWDINTGIDDEDEDLTSKGKSTARPAAPKLNTHVDDDWGSIPYFDEDDQSTHTNDGKGKGKAIEYSDGDQQHDTRRRSTVFDDEDYGDDDNDEHACPESETGSLDEFASQYRKQIMQKRRPRRQAFSGHESLRADTPRLPDWYEEDWGDRDRGEDEKGAVSPPSDDEFTGAADPEPGPPYAPYSELGQECLEVIRKGLSLTPDCEPRHVEAVLLKSWMLVKHMYSQTLPARNLDPFHKGYLGRETRVRSPRNRVHNEMLAEHIDEIYWESPMLRNLVRDDNPHDGLNALRSSFIQGERIRGSEIMLRRVIECKPDFKDSQMAHWNQYVAKRRARPQSTLRNVVDADDAHEPEKALMPKRAPMNLNSVHAQLLADRKWATRACEQGRSPAGAAQDGPGAEPTDEAASIDPDVQS